MSTNQVVTTIVASPAAARSCGAAQMKIRQATGVWASPGLTQRHRTFIFFLICSRLLVCQTNSKAAGNDPTGLILTYEPSESGTVAHMKSCKTKNTIRLQETTVEGIWMCRVYISTWCWKHLKPLLWWDLDKQGQIKVIDHLDLKKIKNQRWGLNERTKGGLGFIALKIHLLWCQTLLPLTHFHGICPSNTPFAVMAHFSERSILEPRQPRDEEHRF